MTPPDPSSDRRERVKQMLANSYPRVREEDREPLPSSVLAELRGEKSDGSAKTERDSFWQRLGALLRGPQALGLGAAAALVLVAVFAILPDTRNNGGDGDPTRSGGTTPPDSPLVILHGLSDAQFEAVRAAPLLRGQWTEVPDGQELAAFQEEKRGPQLIVVDGTNGTITMPFSTDDPPPEIEFDQNTDLKEVLLNLLSDLAEGSSE